MGSSSPSRMVAAVGVVCAAAAWWALIASYGTTTTDHDRALAPSRSNHPRRRRQLRTSTVANRTSTGDASNVIGDQSRRSLLEINLKRTTYKIARPLEDNLLDWETNADALLPEGIRPLPIFWHVLKSGGTTIKLMYAQCYHLVEACESGVLEQHVLSPEEWMQQQEQQAQQQSESGGGIDQSKGQQQQPSLSSEGQAIEEVRQKQDFQQPWEWMQQQQQEQAQQQLVGQPDGQRRRLAAMPNGSEGVTQQQEAQPQQDIVQQPQQGGGQLKVVVSEDGRQYVDVDVTTPEGIQSASQLGFATSNLADVMFSPLLLESAESLLQKNGRMFAVFRHPIERVVSIFYYLQGATWEPTYNPEYAGMTIGDYANSAYCESNWMVRSLTSKMTGPLTPDDIIVAKEVLRKKCLIGLMEGMEESIIRFHSYFKFGDENALECSRRYFANKGSGQSNSHKHPKLDQASETWEVLAKKNALDIRLYEYAQELFAEQGQWMRERGLIG